MNGLSQTETKKTKSTPAKVIMPSTTASVTSCHGDDVRDDEEDADDLPMTRRTKMNDRSYTRRTRSLYGVSPNCSFGPKGFLEDTSETIINIPDPTSQRLHWHKPPQSVLVVRKIHDDSVLIPFRNLLFWLIEERNMIVFVESKMIEDQVCMDEEFQKIVNKLQTFKEDEDKLTDKIDFILCLGGDGTLLYVSSLFQTSVPPVMAFNMGSLGFLTPFQIHEFREQISTVLEGNATLILRNRLKCVVCKHSSTDCSDIPHIKHIDPTMTKRHILECVMVLNEIVIDRGPAPYLSNIDLYIEGHLVTSVQGDGLIISTPTGSTAYAVSAGASMVHPSVPCILITPICPHSLSFRPVIVPAGVEIKVMVSPEARNNAWVSFDGRNRQEIEQGDSVRITTAVYPLPSICAKDQVEDWFGGLADCLHWNIRRTQKSLSSGQSSGSLDTFDSESNAGSTG
ncbi:NAD kinase-like isoform X2 [Gigantopelta aegis]|uniref:NAD kinase-like isoform X2 n=1 Tax=Gigantopelta aegis TaxID=1735272 RepID=UPI001B88D0B9|nr:NAD kinase-like isoform X2 [Gigantopelta aegis]